ncbi:hypothetical protein PYCC9005_003851 [Savitreella phatthalungensis]
MLASGEMSDNSRQSSVDELLSRGRHTRPHTATFYGAQHVEFAQPSSIFGHGYEHGVDAYGEDEHMIHPDGQRPPEMNPEDRAKIYALFQTQLPEQYREPARSALLGPGADSRLERNHGDDDAGDLCLTRHRNSGKPSNASYDHVNGGVGTESRKTSRAKKFGLTLRNIFMNEQPAKSPVVIEQRGRTRAGTWEDPQLLARQNSIAKTRAYTYDPAYVGTL